jgi:hypothetical protein
VPTTEKQKKLSPLRRLLGAKPDDGAAVSAAKEPEAAADSMRPASFPADGVAPERPKAQPTKTASAQRVAPGRKTVTKQAPAAKKSTAKKATTAKKTPAKTAAKKTTATKAPATKATAKKATAKKATAKKATAKKAR